MANNRSSSDNSGRHKANRSRSSEGLVDAVETSQGLAHLATAWSKAAAHAFFDTVGVANQFAADLTDSVIDGLSPVRVTGAGRGAKAERAKRIPVLTQVSDSLTRALNDAADVISRSAEQFERASRKEGEAVPSADHLSVARAGSTISPPPAG